MNKAQIGKRGEQVAAAYLKRKGYQILDRNVHVSHHEIDIIAVYRTCIVFVEVKTRTIDPEKSDFQTTPGAAVTYEKQTHLLRAASKYIRQNGYEMLPRMDVLEVYLADHRNLNSWEKHCERISELFGIPPKRKVVLINHIENAFGLHGYRP